jgi:hypothetical protein
MVDNVFLNDLITNGIESDFLDFKRDAYRTETHPDLIIDIMSMANSKHLGKKYIITGVKETPFGTKELVGIDISINQDASVYQELIYSNIEPEIGFHYYTALIDSKWVGVFEIYESNNKPFMLKKKNKRNFLEGYCSIRKGSVNKAALRRDFDDFYLSRENFEVEILEPNLRAVNVVNGCANLEVAIRNDTNQAITLVHGILQIKNRSGVDVSLHRVFGFKKFVGADFQLSLTPKSEQVGDLLLGFESSDCLRLNLDEYGHTNERFEFLLTFTDSRGKKYKTQISEGFVYAQGDFLWKVKLKK